MLAAANAETGAERSLRCRAAIADPARGLVLRLRDAGHRRIRRRLVAGRIRAFSAVMVYAVPMAASDKRKQSLYFPEEMLKEIGDEATRQDRSLSWIVQKAWKAARKDIMNIPSVEGFSGEQNKDSEPK
jgi:uncharacterized small protein (TIGR04563 family)